MSDTPDVKDNEIRDR